MAATAPFSATISHDLSTAEREQLLLALQRQAEIQTGAVKDPTVDTIVVIIKTAGDLAGAAAGAIELAKAITEWRREAHKRGVQAKATLKRPTQPSLDLETASEDELIDWLLEQTPKH